MILITEGYCGLVSFVDVLFIQVPFLYKNGCRVSVYFLDCSVNSIL